MLDRSVVIQNKDAWHLLTCSDSVVCKVWHRCPIMSQHNTIVFSSPIQNGWIISLRQIYVLDPD